MRKFAILMLLIGAAHATSGCTNTVTGTIDGLQLPAMQSAFYIEAEDGYGEDGTIVVWMSSVEDACVRTGEVLEAQDATDDPAELEAIWQTWYPEDFWEVTVVMRTADVNASLANSTLEGVPWDVESSESGQAFASFTHFLRSHDAPFWDGSGEYERYQDLFYTDGGGLDVDLHVPGERVAGRFDADVADWDDGDVQGDVVIDFDADRCRGVERVFF